MPKLRRKEEKFMLKDEVLEKIFTNEEAHTVPIGYQSTMIHVVENVLDEMRKEKPYAELSELFSDVSESESADAESIYG